jgi:hypothetical protein
VEQERSRENIRKELRLRLQRPGSSFDI